MRYGYYLLVCILLFCMTGLNGFSSYASAQTHLLVHIYSKPSPKGSSDAIKPGDDTSEILMTLLTKQFTKSGYRILTLKDINTSGQISSKDIKLAGQGNLKLLRKVGALSNTAYVLNGTARVSFSEQDVMKMKLNKAVTILSYKLIESATGKILEVDSLQSIGASRSPETAFYVSAEKLSEDLTRNLSRKIHVAAKIEDQEKLVNYQKKIRNEKTKTPSETLVEESLPKPVAPKAILDGKQNGYPQIIIINPPVSRGFKVVGKYKSLKIEGMAIDKTGIDVLRINSDLVDVNSEGYFSSQIELHPGENDLEILAINRIGNTTTKQIQIILKEDKLPPQLTLYSPKTNRGLAVINEKSSGTIKVSGLVKDESGVLFLRINGKDVSLGDDGRFSNHMKHVKGKESIIIETADTLGNKTEKRLKISRLYEKGKKDLVTYQDYHLNHGAKPAFWGLGIGVSKYKSTSVDLKYADDDVVALKSFFVKQAGKLFSEVHFKTLINESVTRESVIKNISTHLGQAAPDDFVFIFVAGHGIKHRQSGSYYFLPYDVDMNNVLSRGLRMSDFKEAVSILSQNVGKVVLAMDTCHSGALNLGTRAGFGGEDLVETLREAHGLYILASAKGGEESIEDEKFKLAENDTGHGVFTYALLKGLGGEANYDQDEYISIHEVFQYVSKQIPRLTKGLQHPYFRAQGTDMPLILADN